MKTFYFFGTLSGNFSASAFSSCMPIAMYSLRRACRERISTTAFSLVIFSFSGKPLIYGGSVSGLRTLISESNMKADEAVNTLKMASLDSELLKHSSMTLKLTLLNSILYSITN